MAEENPISPISDAQPPKVNPIKPAVGSTLKLNPVVRKPAVGGATSALKPGLKLPPKTGATVSTLRPGLKLPPKPGTATQAALKPGLKLPPRPQIRKPGETVAASPIPKPIIPSAAPQAADEAVKPVEAPKPVEDVKTAEAVAPVVEPVKPAVEPVKPAVEAIKPVAKIDASGVAKLPTVEAPAVKRDEPIVTPEPPKPMDALKSVTQKLKGITQSIPQQAILHKTGIIADSATSEAQKEAAKHKTARISLADALGAAPVKNENAP
ncbi:MAG: hypothetical protein IKZ22_07800, partial [Kiritimatiellae bacterium]|nr:hypothetical protein [Kiritimatiellia bacterium]